MTTTPSTRFRSPSTFALLAVSAPFLLAASGFLGLIALSMIPASPTGEIYRLSQRLDATRTAATAEGDVCRLDLAVATLDAARRAVAAERDRPWHLRSYERARALLQKTDRLLVLTNAGPPGIDSDQPVPAG